MPWSSGVLPTNIAAVGSPQVYFHAMGLLDTVDLHIKLEGLNPAGSIKIKTAWYLIRGMERRGEIQPNVHTIIESSSGNLGVALAMVCNQRGYGFRCIIDPNTSDYCREMITMYGGELEEVTGKDEGLGYLPARLERVRQLLHENKSFRWTNQYASEDNLNAHFSTTAPEIHKEFPQLDLLFIGTSTTGTLAGCSRYFRTYSPGTKIIAVEPEGSVTFCGEPKLRKLPGLGTGKRPPLADLCQYDELVFIPELETIRVCRFLKDAYSLMLGASSGTVVAAAMKFASEHGIRGNTLKAVAISPDTGEKYAATVYNDQWVQEQYGEVPA